QPSNASVRRKVPVFGSFLIPRHRFGIVSANSQTLLIKPSNGSLSFRVGLTCGFAVPRHGFCVILLDSSAMFVKPPDVLLRLSVSLICRFDVPDHCIGIILFCEILVADAQLRLGARRLSGSSLSYRFGWEYGKTKSRKNDRCIHTRPQCTATSLNTKLKKATALRCGPFQTDDKILTPAPSTLFLCALFAAFFLGRFFLGWFSRRWPGRSTTASARSYRGRSWCAERLPLGHGPTRGFGFF